jgi:hypothetical protein
MKFTVFGVSKIDFSNPQLSSFRELYKFSTFSKAYKFAQSWEAKHPNHQCVLAPTQK